VATLEELAAELHGLRLVFEAVIALHRLPVGGGRLVAAVVAEDTWQLVEAVVVAGP
jgi:hypothetical protein